MLINEWLPNPKGSDGDAEWVEILNNEKSAVDLGGWKLKNDKGASVTLSPYRLGAGEYLVFYKKDTHLALRNSDGSISLFDANGNLADKSSFIGSAPEGKSFARIGTMFSFGDPSPGVANPIPSNNLIVSTISSGPVIPLAKNFPWGEMVGTGLALAIGIVVIIKNHDTLRELLFGGNKTFSGETRETNSFVAKGK